MSAGGDIVREALNLIPEMTDSPRKRIAATSALAALARLEAAETTARENYLDAERGYLREFEARKTAEAQRDTLAEAATNVEHVHYTTVGATRPRSHHTYDPDLASICELCAALVETGLE